MRGRRRPTQSLCGTSRPLMLGAQTKFATEGMRKINTRSFVRATRATPREVNRQILLNLVREHEPISRADLARRMEIARGMVTSLVDELIADGSLYEGATVDRKSTRLNSSHTVISYAVFCLKKKKNRR